jgi:exopolyphosphatase/guanosine-5'-triphosphate,3'-diphosphate pyrophosphatase
MTLSINYLFLGITKLLSSFFSINNSKRLLLIVFSAAYLGNLAAAEVSNMERRASIDVGSGSTKVTIADVDTTHQKIIEVVFEESFPVPYQASLESSLDGSFDVSIRNLGLKTFHQIKEITEDYQVIKVAAVATAAFRDASNGDRFANEVQKETGIPLRVIPQKEEGTLAFFSGMASSGYDSEGLIVWDIGTGSFQITTMNGSQDLSVFMGGVGSIPFRNYIIDLIQGKNSDEISTPNPMTDEDVKGADRFARSLGRKAYPIIKEKIKRPETILIGIGRLFSSSVGPIGQDGVVTRKDLRTFIDESIGLTDEELDNPFANVDVSNAILVLAFMKALHIHEIYIIDTKTTRGMLIYPPYWN